MIFKVLDEAGRSCNGGSMQWSLPTQSEDGTWTPGEWTPEIVGDLAACENGYHLCANAQVLRWLGPMLCEAEYDGECLFADDKIVARKARLLRILPWDEATVGEFARWCALQVAHLWDMPDMVWRYLETGDESIRAAASAAARAAARAAAWDAARAAAWDAARAAAWDAASAAASAAAWDSQYTKLCELLGIVV